MTSDGSAWVTASKCRSLHQAGHRQLPRRHLEMRNSLLTAERRGRLSPREKIEDWRRHYNGERPHGALGNLTPETFASKTPAVVG